MKKFKKVLSCAAAAAMAVTGLVGSVSATAADETLITNGGPYSGDATYISTNFKADYQGKTAFEIQYKYTEVGTPSAPQSGEDDLQYGDTFEFLVFDTAWGGWNRTTVGPDVVDKASTAAPSTGTTYTATVPISTIEGKLKTGGSPYGINLQTGAQLGTSKVEIVSLKLVEGTTPYVQEAFTATGSWTRGTASTMTVDPNGAAIVNPNEYNIEVSGLDLSAWKNPTVEVTATYASASNYSQAEILIPTGEIDADGYKVHKSVDPNYVSKDAGTYTFTTEIPNTVKSFLACYDSCTVTEVKVYDNVAGNVEKSVTGKTAAEIADDMGVAWNLGNSLEAVDGNSSSETYGQVGEKCWGNPKTTKKLIQAVKAAGFNTIRVPVSYINKINSDNTIDDEYIARIKQVVNYAYDMGMYVIINIHNDGAPTVVNSWIDISKTGTEFDAIKTKYATVWTDIANNFKDYDQKLIFESANELMIKDKYSISDTELTAAYTNINALNQAFVTAVRSTGTKNDDRVLIIPGYNTNIDYTTSGKGFVKPTDSTANRLMLSVHYYAPDNFTMGGAEQWPTGDESADNYYSKAYMESQINKAAATGKSLGMPVFLGEYGPENNNNNTSARANYCYWLNYYAALNGNIVTAYWDNGVTGQGGTALFDRTNNEITVAGNTIKTQIFAGYDAGVAARQPEIDD